MQCKLVFNLELNYLAVLLERSTNRKQIICSCPPGNQNLLINQGSDVKLYFFSHNIID